MLVEKLCASDIVGDSQVKMLIESSLCSSFETSFLNESQCQNPFAGNYWLSHGEACQMFHKFPENYAESYSDAKPATGGKYHDVSSHPNHQTICPVQPMTNKTLGKSLISHVYRRRNLIVKPGCTSTEDNPGNSKGRDYELNDSLVSQDDRGVATRRGDRLNNCRVYSRRKWRLKSACAFTEHDSKETKRSGDQLDDSLFHGQKKQRLTTDGTFTEHCPGKNKRRGDCPDNLVVYYRKKRKVKLGCTLTDHDSGETKKSSDGLSVVRSLAGRHFRSCDRECDISNLKHAHESPVSEVACVSGRMASSCMRSTREVGSKNYGGSSSKSISGRALTFMRSGAGEATGCSSSGAIVAENIPKDITAEDLPSSVLRSDCLLDGSWPGSTSSLVEETVIVGASSSSRQCKICDRSGIVENMLICDKCEGVFHTYCCSVKMREIPEIDEWLCPSCLKKKQKIFKKTNDKKRGRAARERKWRTSPPQSEVCPVALMLRGAERYKPVVRIGKQFQAKVPDWSGPTTSETSLVGEPLEINQSDYMHHININSASKLSSVGNWLQCREEDVNGDICGKWRRAPLSEVQTDDWECYCCILWDPPHADCAVPQELETSEILKQVKYIETLRPRLDARRRKLKRSKGCGGPQANTSSR